MDQAKAECAQQGGGSHWGTHDAVRTTKSAALATATAPVMLETSSTSRVVPPTLSLEIIWKTVCVHVCVGWISDSCAGVDVWM
jgi:hypothetical protein